MRVWNVKARSVLYTLAQHTAPVMCVRWGGEGALFTAGRDREIKVWNETDVS